jgi:hypothetical protein
MFSKRDAAQKLVPAALLATVKTCQIEIQMRKLASYCCQRALPPSTRSEYHQVGSLCNCQSSSLTPADWFGSFHQWVSLTCNIHVSFLLFCVASVIHLGQPDCWHLWEDTSLQWLYAVVFPSSKLSELSVHIVMLLSWYLKCCISMWTDIIKPFCFIFSSKDHALQRFFRLFSLIFLFPCLVLSWFFLLFCIPLPSWFPQSTPSLFIHVEHHGWVFLFHFMLSDLETA